MIRAVALLVLAASSLGAQSLSIRVGTTSVTNVYLNPNDTIPLRMTGRTASGGTVTPTNPSWSATAHCVGGAFVNTVSTKITELPCGLEAGYIIAQGTVSGVVVRDSVMIQRPSFSFGSNLGVCLANPEANPALRYTSKDTLVIVGIGVEGGWATASVPSLVSFGWQAGVKVLPFKSIACMPNYTAVEVTTSSYTTWTTSDISTAVVSRGQVTWKRAAPFTVTAKWRNHEGSWILQ